MSTIIQNNFRVSAAGKFISQVGQTDNIIYAFLGKSLPWDDENTPTVPNDWVQSTIDAYDDMLYLKRIIPNDVYRVIRRYNWERAYVYEIYTHADVLFDPARGVLPFYVVTDAMNVYKCISNGYGKPSINKPTGTSAGVFSTGDGYLWKYMYTVTSDLSKFVTPEFIPVKPTGSVGARNYGIEHIQIVNGGLGYPAGTVALTVTGSGTGCSAYGKTVDGVITEIVITNRGEDYRSAAATCPAPPPGGTQATFLPIISPPGGHGSNPAQELGGHFVMMIARFSRDESGKFSTSNDFRKIGLIENPKDYLRGTVLSADALSMTQDLSLSSVVGIDYAIDEVITGSISGVTARVVDYTSSTQILRVSNSTGEFVPGETLTGTDTSTTGLLDIGVGATGTCQSGGLTTVTLDALAPTDIYFSGYSTVIRITAGTGVGQIKVIEDDSYDPNTKLASIIGFWDADLIPDATSEYVLSWIKYPDVEKDSGQMLFVEHRRPITRASDQIEEAKCVVEF